MRNDEFIELNRKYQKARSKVPVVALVWAIICITAVTGALITLGDLISDNGLNVIGVVSIMSLAAIILGYEKITPKKVGMICPSCSHPFGTKDIKLVFSGKNCPYCGGAVIE